MKRLVLGVMAILLLSPFANAAPLEDFSATLAEIDTILAREESMVHKAWPEIRWIGNDKLLFRSNASRLDIRLIDTASPTISTLLAEDGWLRAALQQAGGDAGDTKLESLSPDHSTLFIMSAGIVYAVDLARKVVALDNERTAQSVLDRPQQISDQFPTTFGPLIEAASPDGKMFVGSKDDNIYVRDRSGQRRMLTEDGLPKHSWLDTEESAQGMNAHWSPDSTRIAAVKLDSREVAYEPLVEWLERAPKIRRLAYPRAGDPIHRFELAIFDVTSGRKMPVETGETANHYVNLIGWSGNGKAVLYQVVDREQKSLRIFRADAKTGAVREILSERRATYIDTAMTLAPVLVHPLAGGGFLYLSEADGWRHIYQYNDDGALLSRLTRGNWAVDDVVKVDERGGWVYFQASMTTPYSAKLFRVRMSDGRTEQFTDDADLRQAIFSPGNAFTVTVTASIEQSPIVELRTADGKRLSKLSQGRAEAGLPSIERFVTRSIDGKFDMHGVIVRPANFDAATLYPVVEVIYGGMQLDFVPRDFYATGWWRQGYNALVGRILANQGFVVVYMNAPGTPGRGRQFQDATYGIWPQTVIANHAKFIRDAASTRPWMNSERVGIFGNSWGGYLAQRAMIDAPGFYKSAVALAPPSDFIDHPTYIEPFMGLPSNNPLGYRAGSNLNRVSSIEGPVLVIPMPFDVNAGFSPGMKFVDAMVAAGKHVELFTLPNINHRVNCCGWQRERHAYAVITRFLRNSLASKSD